MKWAGKRKSKPFIENVGFFFWNEKWMTVIEKKICVATATRCWKSIEDLLCVVLQ